MAKFLDDPFGKFEKHTLDSGINVHVCQLPKRATQAFHFAINAGTLHGPKGLAHFAEHIVAHSKGSGEATKLKEEFERIGGGFMGGWTSLDATAYAFDVPAERALVGKYLKRFSVYIMECTHEYDEKIENGIFLAERNERVRSPFQEKLRKQRSTAIMHDHPFGDQLSLLFGSPEEITGRNPADVKNFYLKYYSACNCDIFTAGPLAAGEVVESLVKANWQKYEKGKRCGPLSHYEPHEPLLKSHAFNSPEVQSTSFLTSRLYDTNIPRRFMLLARRALRKVSNDLLREQSGSVYSVRTNMERWGNVHLLELESMGLQKNRIQEAFLLYKNIFETIESSAFSKIFDYVQESMKNASLYEEFITRDIPQTAHERILNYGKIISNREISESVQQVKIDEVRNILMELHPLKTFTRWILPSGVQPPAGVPLLDIDETIASLEKKI